MRGFTVRIAAGALSGLVLLAGCSRSGGGGNGNGPETVAVARTNLEIRVEATGQIEPIRFVEVKSKASGEVLRISAETGDNVQPGTLLVEIDPRDVRNAYEQAKADLEVAQARARTAQTQRQRSEELRAANVVTAQEYENAVLEEANARAQLVKAQTNLELAEERLGDVTIRAPMAGTIIKRDVEVGQIIQSASQNISGGTTLLTMADLTEMQVRTLVDEMDLGRIAAGQEARVSVEAYPNRPFIGTVLKVEPQAVVEQNVTMFPVLVRLDNRDMLLKPGMRADVQVEVARRENVLAVPNAAVVDARNALAAATTLGVSEDAMQAALRGGTRTAAAGPENGAAPAAETTGPGAAAAAAPVTPEECAALREKVQQGGFQALSDADREKMRACRPAGAEAAGPGAAAAQTDAAAQAAGAARAGGGFAMAGGRGGRPGVGRGDVRPGVVFILNADGSIAPRMVMLGLNDWDYTEVLSGLEGGEAVVLISVAQMQRAQEEFNQRMRERMGGFPGAGGPGTPRR